MVGIKRRVGATLSILVLATTTLHAEASGKIFMNGSWHSAQSVGSAHNNSAQGALPFFPLPENTWSRVGLANSFIKANRDLLGLARGDRFVPENETQSTVLQTVRLKRTWNFIPVVGGEVLVHSQNGKVEFASGDAIRLDSLDIHPKLTATAAGTLAFASYAGKAADIKKNELKIITTQTGQEKLPHLTYAVTIKDRDGISSNIHYIDAHSGENLLTTSNVHTIRQRKILAGEGSENDFELDTKKYKLVYHENTCPNDQCPNKESPEIVKSAATAWENSGMVYDYFRQRHGRQSIDNKDMEIRSVVNFGEKFSNAAWIDDYGLMIYGMGDGDLYNDFAIALDVAAHELTHGITSKTANLEYVAESGALNESYSDVFGKLVAFEFNKSDDWLLGKDIFKDGKSAIRDMKNPTIGHTRDYRYRNEQCSQLNDWCGVHSNSGIPNRAAVIIAEAIGKEKMGKIYYLTLTQLLKSTSGFTEARAQTEAACDYLYGERTRECITVREAFSAVGIEMAKK